MRKILLYAALLLLPAVPAFADGDPSSGELQHDARTGAEKVGTDASVADKRLPPVFPGEEVKDGKNTIKTWTTTGPVPVSRPPEPWKDDTNYGLRLNNGVGIVVDGRRDDVRPPPQNR